jgi:organic hydroperoxide reductase OsmC/OhrA
MATENVAAAMLRVQTVLQRKPQTGIHDDAPATARWHGDLRVVASHANGTQIATDMPKELGGTGDQVTPGWLFRAGLASCFATCIAMHAAAQGIALGVLEVHASSRSDLRGLFGMAAADGTPVGAGPIETHLAVRVGAPGVAAERLTGLVEQSYRCSPISAALRDAVPVSLAIELEGVQAQTGAER